MVYVWQGDCVQQLERLQDSGIKVAMTFLDPPFNQGKEYQYFNDNRPEEEYWEWMRIVCQKVYDCSSTGGALYFMQREKNTEQTLRCMRETGWEFQNLLIWQKKTSAVPCPNRFGKQYQIIAFGTKGKSPRVFNRLRIDPPPRPEHKIERMNGVYVTDCWDDVREMTSGYLAGDEALRKPNGERFHKQQSPTALLLRLILASTQPDDWVLDPFSGTGTTAVVAQQLQRNTIAIEIDPDNARMIQWRLQEQRDADSIAKLRPYYRFTENLNDIWQIEKNNDWQSKRQMNLFEAKAPHGDS